MKMNKRSPAMLFSIIYLLFFSVTVYATEKVALMYANFDANPQYALDDRNFEGFIEVENIAYIKEINIHYSVDSQNWQSIAASYAKETFGNKEAWDFNETIASDSVSNIEFAIEYKVAGQTYWDNNNGQNYTLASSVPYFDEWNLALVYAQRSNNGTQLTGLIKLKNIAFEKDVKIKYTYNGWSTSAYQAASYSEDYSYPGDEESEKWFFDFTVENVNTIEFVVEYTVNGVTYLDNNIGRNFKFTQQDQELRGLRDGFIEDATATNLNEPMYLRGSFNNEAANNESLAVRDNAIYTASVFLEAGTHTFKLANEDWSQAANFGAINGETIITIGTVKTVITEINDPKFEAISLTLAQDGQYDFTLDTTSLTQPTLLVSLANIPPLASAGTNQTIAAGQSVVLDATASQDSDGEIVTYSWNNGLTGVTPSVQYNTAGIFPVVLTVTDNLGATATSSVVITVEKDTIEAVAAGKNHSCSLHNDGSVKCWGQGKKGQLGNNTTSKKQLTPINANIGNVIALDAGNQFSCAVIQDGSIQCWGHGKHGKLGNGATSNHLTPVTVDGISNAVAVTTGADHACALLDSGSVSCWGRNNNGQIGDGTKASRTTPVAVTGISDAIQISAGRFHTCAVLNSGSIQCWGKGRQGQLGNDARANSYEPVTVASLTNAEEVTAGGNHSCARLADNSVKCWGLGKHGQLGNGETTKRLLIPTALSTPLLAKKISAGYNYTCAVLISGSVQCWGHGKYGKLGNGSTAKALSPVTVTGLNTIDMITTGNNHVLGLDDSGSVWAWGNGAQGRLGNNTTGHKNTPVSTTGL